MSVLQELKLGAHLFIYFSLTMSVIHLYPDNGEIICTEKEAFIGKEVRLKELPPFSCLFSDKIEGVVFRLPAIIKSRKVKPIFFALTSFVAGKYYKISCPKNFESFLDRFSSNNLFFIGSVVISDLMDFHYVKEGDILIRGAETVNFISKGNSSLKNLIPKIVPSDARKKIFIVGLFSIDLLELLRKKYPFCEIEVRYYDVITPNQLPSFKSILAFSVANGIKVSVYDHKTASAFGVSYEMNKVNKKKLLPYLTQEKKYDVCFLAMYSPARAELLKPLLKIFRQAKLRVKLLLFGYGSSELEGFKVDNTILSYDDYLKLVGASKAVIDLWRIAPDEGYSFRIPEALALNTKIITNRPEIIREPFYDESRILFFSRNKTLSEAEITKFLSTPFIPTDESFFNVGSRK